MLKMLQAPNYAVVQREFSINSILQELDYAISQRCHGTEKYLVHDVEKPLSAREFYDIIKFEIQDILGRIIDDNDFMKKQLQEFPAQADYVEALINDFAKETAQRILK